MTIEQVTNLPFNNLEGSTQRGGWQVTGAIINDQDAAQYSRHAKVYARLEGGGSWESENTVAISGSLIPNVLRFDRKQSSVEVLLATSDMFLSAAGLQGIYFSQQASPDNPHQMTVLNLGKIIEHIITGHTNIAAVASSPGGWVDISRIDTLHSTSVDVYTVRQSSSIWQTIEGIASNEFYVRYMTKLDEFVYEPHPQFKATLPPVTLSLTTSDIVAQPEVAFNNDLGVDQVRAYALTDTGVILQSFYPTTVGTEGRRLPFTNLRCNNQSRLNLLAERAFLHVNRDLISVRITLAGAWGAFLELYDRISITYSGTATNGVSLSWSDKKFWISTIRVNRMGNFGAVTELELEEENL